MTLLIAGSREGLCNRLRAVISGQYLAQRFGRRFIAYWPVNQACGASFSELFENDVQAVIALPQGAAVYPRALGIQKARSIEEVVCFDSFSYLVPDQDRFLCSSFYEALRPRDCIRTRIDELASQLDRRTLGLHIRRGDFQTYFARKYGRQLPDLQAYCRAVDERLDTTVFLATDGGSEVERPLRQRYGKRLLVGLKDRPGALVRSTARGVRTAVVELWLLRRTATVIGTYGSSFSRMAAWQTTLIAVGAPQSP